MSFKDYCAVLGVRESASAQNIKRACRKRARYYHLDASKKDSIDDMCKMSTKPATF